MFAFLSTDKCNLYPSLRKLLFAKDGDLYKKRQLVKMQSCGAQSQGLHLQNTHMPKAQRTLQKSKWKDCTSQRNSEFAVRLGLLAKSEAIPIKSPQHDNLSMS